MGSYFLTGEEAPSSTIQEARAQRDACYLVEAVSENGRIDLGDTTFIRGMVSSQDYSQGYVYNFEPGNTFEIPTLVHVKIEGDEPAVVRTNCEWNWDPS